LSRTTGNLAQNYDATPLASDTERRSAVSFPFSLSIVKHAVFVCILSALTLFLFLRSSEPNRWSDWDFADAQDMLALEHWKNEGFLKLHFLWVPQGYSSASKHLDEPPINHQAHGTDKRISGLNKNCRIYTHYPSWYAVSYGVLKKLGVNSKTSMQFFAIILSLLSVIAMYTFLFIQFDTKVATLFVAFYVCTHAFLGYCDSINTMPYDDLSRFAFILTWALYAKSGKRKWMGISCGIYFVSCMTSIDSILFIMIWAAGYNFLFRGRFHWLELAVLGIFPLAAVGIQFFQNSLYLGTHDALTDWRSYFLQYSSKWHYSKSPWWKLASRIRSTLILFSRSFKVREWMAPIVLLAGLPLYKKINLRSNALKILLLLFVAGSGYVFIFPNKGLIMGYHVRLFAPFCAFFFALSSIALIHERRKAVLVIGWLVFGFCLWHQYGNFRGDLDFPSQPRFDAATEDFLKQIDGRVPGDKILMQIGNVLPLLDATWDSPQVHPFVEYYAKALAMWEPDLSHTLSDVSYLRSRESGFRSVVVVSADSSKVIESELKSRNISVVPLVSSVGLAAFLLPQDF
jgi:hypothetical protein